MKIIQINCVYPSGSTGKIVRDLHNYLLDNGVDSKVIFGRGQRGKNAKELVPLVYCKFQKLLSIISGVMYGGCFYSTTKLIHILKREQPDIVHLQCINGNFINIYRLIKWLKKNNIITILTLHAEFMYTGNCGHAFECNQYNNGCQKCLNYKNITKSLFFNRTEYSWNRMYKAFQGFRNLEIVSVSHWLMHRAQNSKILCGFNHCCIENGLDINTFNNRFDSKPIKDNVKIILHVTPYFSCDDNDLKGGKYIVELAKLINRKDIRIVVVGSYDTDIPPIDNIQFLGKVTDQNRMAELYSQASVTVITSKRETFSMVCAESLSCGTPVVGFYAGAPETICLSDFSLFCNYGDVNNLLNNIYNILDSNYSKQHISLEAHKRYSAMKMGEKYMELYKNMMEKE